jgi:hypothetical protein
MSCGNLFLQDPVGRFWSLSSDNSGVLVTTLTTTVLAGFSPPIITSASFYWSLSVGIDGAIIASVVSSRPASPSYLLTSSSFKTFLLTIDDNGVLATTSQTGIVVGQVPFPSNVNMSVWPPLGLTSSVAGATPLTVSADFSIWSCTLNQFINEDTTNIIVVLDE